MGVVYLGDDTRLARKVAIKALPEHLAHDPERLGRFERNARTLANADETGRWEPCLSAHPDFSSRMQTSMTGDGENLLLLEGPHQDAPVTELQAITNFTTELQRRLGEGGG